MIKKLIKEKQSINLIIKHLFFQTKQIDFALKSLENRSKKLHEENKTYLEKKEFSKYLSFFYKGDYEKESGYYFPHNYGVMLLGKKSENGSYVGQFKNGLFDGLGTKEINDKTKYLENERLNFYYSGEWFADKYHGLGQLKSELKILGIKWIEDTYGYFYFGKLNGFGQKFLAKKKSKKKDGSSITGYFEFNEIKNFFLRIVFENELIVPSKSGLYFFNKDDENTLLHQFQSRDEIDKLINQASSKDEKMPNDCLDFYKDYFNKEFKTDKFKKLYLNIIMGMKIFEIDIIRPRKSEIKKNRKRYIEIFNDLLTQLEQSTKINELEKINQNLKNCFNEIKN